LVAALTVLHPAAAQLKIQIDAGGKVQDRPNEDTALLKAVTEAYKAPLEVDKDIRDELKKQYQNYSPDREQKILREVRRLYVTNPEQEARIVAEMRRAVETQAPDSEDRVFTEIRRMGKLPPGTVPASSQSTQAEKLFNRFDANHDGVLSPDEVPDGLKANFAKWDANRDGVIDAKEYWAYYQASLKTVSDKVASGEIAIKLPGGATVPKPAAPPLPGDEEYKLQIFRAGKLPPGLPDWFTTLDTDGDGQIGLYEWRAAGWAIEDFQKMDLNGDGLITVEEYLKWKKDADALTAKQGATPQRLNAAGKLNPAVTVKPTAAGGKPDKPNKGDGPPPGKFEKKNEKKGGDALPAGNQPTKGG
jgi:Ca2+-binding EF-hand superfamily protein